MSESVQWQVLPRLVIGRDIPEAFVVEVRHYTPKSDGHWAATLLWQRGIREVAALAQFVEPAKYESTSPFAFGEEMERAIARLVQAYHQQEAIAIWGDFDADGITATAVLWDGLGQFFPPYQRLTYVIPNRLTESHGLNRAGIAALQQQGYRLIVTCDTGSTNVDELRFAQEVGIDVIVTDHHTLLRDRPPVTALINPRSLPAEHPLASLSGVAVAYKLVEALYAALPDIPAQPLETLLDLVAIGLIADLVELKGDCRYLAQRGIEALQKNLTEQPPPRPGVARLLELCRRSGDRPTDISFGVGPRINAISRIHGDAHFGVELLTSRDIERCNELALETELANTRRKALQRDLFEQVTARLSSVDLATTSVIVLADEQWEPGVLGLVAGQVAQEYGRPTILLAIDEAEPPMARGSARSLNNIDLYQLVQAQSHLLHRFGGHPFAAGLSLPMDNLPLFTEALNRQLREQQVTLGQSVGPILQADLTVTVADLGEALFHELKLLEPCGMGNPTPKLLIQNCRFTRGWNANLRDASNAKVRYIKTEFQIEDETGATFPGVWWGHYRDELPTGYCDAIAELDFNSYRNEARGKFPHYEIRLLAVRPTTPQVATSASVDWILDWRTHRPAHEQDALVLTQCPSSWNELQRWLRRAQQEHKPLAIAYLPPKTPSPVDLWTQLVGMAKHLSRTHKTATQAQLQTLLGIGDHSLQRGLDSLQHLGFTIVQTEDAIAITGQPTSPSDTATHAIEQFFQSVREAQFRQQYFAQVPISTIQAIAQGIEGEREWGVKEGARN
ncbi:single-stranded-DNA-specific exonuclease RecJ [Leptolyngbya sp. AN02str]|uniref:single-stranded-DNA-specific exonuclease RecJ n=1 Tax=Leptolyngbya sp. AN02str TaxID=3423363 RepID=UPI003D31BDAA